jgi:hypothetical protein
MDLAEIKKLDNIKVETYLKSSLRKEIKAIIVREYNCNTVNE